MKAKKINGLNVCCDSQTQTNLAAIRKAAKMFLYADILETNVPFIATHPFTNSWVTMSKDCELVDLHNNCDARKWRNELEKVIDKSDLIGIFMMLNKPYILSFLKHTSQYMTDDDLGKILTGFWQSIEQISLDKSVSGREIVSWFTRVDKDALMSSKEKSFYDALPDKVTVYRGVTDYNQHRRKAVSWSTDKSVAEWFAKRFSTGTGKVWTTTVPKERVLYHFDGNEKEVIVNLYGFDGKIEVEECN